MGTKSKPTADDAAPSVDDVIETFWCDLRQLQILMRAEQAKLVLPRPEYVSQKANHLRDNFVAAGKVFDQWHTQFAKLHTDPIKFFGVTATSYGAMIRELTLRSFKILESLRLGFATPQYSIVTTSFSPYSFSLNDVKKLRRWFDTQEPFHFSGSPDEQVAQIHQRFGELLVGFRQECAHVDLPKPNEQTADAPVDDGDAPDGMPSGELRNLMERVILSMGENGITTATLKKSSRRIAFVMKPKQNWNSQLRKTLRLLRLPPHELLSPSSGHGYFLNSRGVAVYEHLKNDRLEMSLKKKKSH